MEVFILLVLSIGLCQARAVVSDSNHPEVVDAVNQAIKVLNEDRSHGNKFALDVILFAYGITGPEKKFRIVYQVRETVCPTAVDKPWQKCELLRTSKARSGNCTADIDIYELQQFTSIVQDCKISRGLHKQWWVPTGSALFRRTGGRGGRRFLSRTSSRSDVTHSHPQTDSKGQLHATCPGCWYHIDILSPKELLIVEHTIEQFNDENQQSSLFGFAEMKEAQSQVVNGVNYRFEYSLKETNCSKNEFEDLSPECKPLSGGLKVFCKAKVYVDNRDTIISSQVECLPEAEDNRRSFAQECPGCHGPISADSQELKRPLEAVVKLFNLKSSSDYYYKIMDITKISGQVIVGHIYRVDFIAQRTNCSKAEVQEPDDHCTAVKGGELMTCHALIYVKPWEPSVEPEVTCEDQQPFQATELGDYKHAGEEITFFDYYDTINEQQNC